MGIRKIIRNSLENYFKIKEFVEEGKKKKKSKKPYYSTATMQTPTGSIFYMDAAVGESYLHEVSAVKVLPAKFNHLKWKLNPEQKHFLDDFVNIHPDTLRESDYKYASKKTGIPEASLKSIQNTYGEWNKPKEVIDNSHGRYALGKGKPITATEYEFEQKYRDDVVNFKTISKDQADALRYPKKTKRQQKYESDLYGSIKGGIQRSNTLKEVRFDNWAMYYIIGKLSPKDGRINEQKKIVEIDFEPTADYNDFQKSMLNSNKKSKYWIEVEKLLEEFNDAFGTTFHIIEQYDLTNSKSKCIRLVIEEFNVGEKMLWDSTEKRYVKWSHAPIDLKKQYLNNRPEKMIKPIQPLDHKEMLDKYLGFDPSMFQGV